MLHHNTLKEIDRVRDDDVGKFLRITNEVLDIDLLYRPTNSYTRQSAQIPTTRHTQQAQQSIPPQQSTTPNVAASVTKTTS